MALNLEQWKAQLELMQKNLSNWKENNPNLSLQEEETDPEDLLNDAKTSKTQHVWDFIDEDNGYHEFFDDVEPAQSFPPEESVEAQKREDFSRKCTTIAMKRGLEPDVFQQQISSLLGSASSNDELQSTLADLIGLEEFDFILELLHDRSSLCQALSTTLEPSSGYDEDNNDLPPGYRLMTRAQQEQALREKDARHKAAPLASARTKEEDFPHVYKSKSSVGGGGLLDQYGRSFGLPLGSQRKLYDKYEEYSVPAGPKARLQPGEKLVPIDSMDGICRGTFRGYRSLNRMQSLVYPVAYKTGENMLICAPTGAGKTDAAMLTILHTVGQYCTPSPLDSPEVDDFAVSLEDFKIVYVAPMKALAAEITEKLGKRLAWLGIKCREYTGDMHLTKAEIVQTQIIVTTPEKWDVVTRKGTGDTELVPKVRLLVIDEVHMLHDERGAVLESLVARTQRQVESTQSMIRIVGLSATLPNYVDVANFLKVNPYRGMFYFDASFRPVPLEQHFIGVKGKEGTRQGRANLSLVAFEKVADMLKMGHQVMIFVHSRRETSLTAKTFIEYALDNLDPGLLIPTDHPKYDAAMRDLWTCKSRDLRDFVPKGLGIHHAGLARSDRNLMERLFSEGIVQVLCCTATLAWGVNLPAAAVVIKGTRVYNAQEGKFGDIGILDVLQIFGRAGRPQFEDTGIGFICTTHDKLQHYLSAITEQMPIESRFSSRLVDNLNAEVALGTVTSIAEAAEWISYSYLFVRMRKNPQMYGIEWQERQDDPMLAQRRRKLAMDAARTLQKCQMIVFNERTEELRSKDLGRIASQYYIRHTTVEIFNTMMSPSATEADNLKMISMSGEFDHVQSRDEEAQDLEALGKLIPCDVEGGLDTSHGKANILLQAYVSRLQPREITLQNDTNYVSQQAARICRSLFQMALHRRWGYQCLVLLTLAKSIERKVWPPPLQHPLHQFELPQPILRALDSTNRGSDSGSLISMARLKDMDAAEIGSLVHNQGMGSKLSRLVHQFPLVHVDAEIAPLSRDVLRIRLILEPDFTWNEAIHGTSEVFYVWVEHSETSDILHHEQVVLNKRKLMEGRFGSLSNGSKGHNASGPGGGAGLELTFTIPLHDPMPSQMYVRAVSDRWIGSETVTPVSFQHLIRPDTVPIHTELLNLRPLPIAALKNPTLEDVYAQRFSFFNPMQTQLFHTLYHTDTNVLLGSPTGSGKTVAAELAMWWAFREHPGCKIVYIAPMKALVRERVQDWGRRLAKPLGMKIVELTGDSTPDTRTIRDADVIITTPEKWDGISRSWQSRSYVRQVRLVILDEIHLLAGDRGPILEMIVSRMNYISAATKRRVRLLGMSTACANAQDLADWLGVPYYQDGVSTSSSTKSGARNHYTNGLFNFRPSVRPVPLEMYIDGFPETRGFCPLMQSMNRPTFLAIKNHSPTKPVIVFVPSRRQTRLTAKDLITFCGMEEDPRRFLHMGGDENELQTHLSRAQDDALREALSFGIGLHHAGLVESDRQLAEELFLHGKIQILIATSTLAWGVNLPAHLVVVKGTQFYDAKIEGYRDMDLTDVLQMLGRAGRPQFDDSGVARILTQESKKDFYKSFLHTGFPVESSLHTVLDSHVGAEIASETITTKQDALDYLTWTFFFRRLHKNPTYYGLKLGEDDEDDEYYDDDEEADDPGHGYGGNKIRVVKSAAKKETKEETDVDPVQSRINQYLIDLVESSFEALVKSKCIEIVPSTQNGTGGGFTVPTAFGKIMSYYYLSHKTIRYMVQHARRNPSFTDALSWLSHATEYDELPVRHNEDLVNGELVHLFPESCDAMASVQAFGLPLWDPHVKSFLLLLAHMFRLPLPIRDYVGDQTSVLDQAIRIAQAAIDVMANLGYLSSVLMMIQLLRHIKSALAYEDHPLSILPGMRDEQAAVRYDDDQNGGLEEEEEERARRNLRQGVLSRPHRKGVIPETLLEVAAMNDKQREGVAERMGLRGRWAQQWCDVAGQLPLVSIASVVVQEDGKMSIGVRRESEPIKFSGKKPQQQSSNRNKRHTKRSDEPLIPAYTPQFSKPQTEGWFVLVADRAADEILAVKRLANLSSTLDDGKTPEKGKNPEKGLVTGKADCREATVTLSLPQEVVGRKGLSVAVISDVYPRLDVWREV